MTDPAPSPDPGPNPGPKPDEFAPITSQADLDRIVGARLAREREKFADYGELKAKATKHDEIIEATRSEQERAVEVARREGETTALSRANERLRSAEARALAAEAKFRNPSLAVRAIDLKDVAVSEDGTVDAEAIRTRLKALSDAEPYLVDDGTRAAPRPDPSQGGGSRKSGSRLGDLDGSALYDRLHPKKAS